MTRSPRPAPRGHRRGAGGPRTADRCVRGSGWAARGTRSRRASSAAGSCSPVSAARGTRRSPRPRTCGRRVSRPGSSTPRRASGPRRRPMSCSSRSPPRAGPRRSSRRRGVIAARASSSASRTIPTRRSRPRSTSSCRCSPGRSARASRAGRTGRRPRSSGCSATVSSAGNGPRRRCARPSRRWRRSSMVAPPGSTTPRSCSTGRPPSTCWATPPTSGRSRRPH